MTLTFREDVANVVNYKATRTILTRVSSIAPDSSVDESDANNQQFFEAQMVRREERLMEALMQLRESVNDIKKKAVRQKTQQIVVDIMRPLLILGGICVGIIVVLQLCCTT